MDKVAYTKQVLKECARKKSVIVGSDLAKQVSLSDLSDVNAVLDSIAEECVESKVPNLTALVVQASTGIPSMRYFKLYEEDLVCETRRDRKRKWCQIRDRIYDHYSN